MWGRVGPARSERVAPARAANSSSDECEHLSVGVFMVACYAANARRACGGRGFTQRTRSTQRRVPLNPGRFSAVIPASDLTLPKTGARLGVLRAPPGHGALAFVARKEPVMRAICYNAGRTRAMGRRGAAACAARASERLLILPAGPLPRFFRRLAFFVAAVE